MLRTIIFCLALASCAKISTKSIDVSQALKDEGSRMHQMNIELVECVFNEKKHMVNEFIANEYAPTIVENFIKRLPPDADIKREMPDIIAAINPKIDARRDSLLMALQSQKTLITKQLNTNYQAYENTFTVLQKILTSTSKPNNKKASMQDSLVKLRNNKINLKGINNALDSFITSNGNISDKTLVLTTTIQSFLK